MVILGIETSCDDTGIAILKASDGKTPDFEILANVVSSQIEIHKKYGGVYPTMARREHEKNLTPVLKKALKQAGILQPASAPAGATAWRGKIQTLEEIFDREPELLENSKKFLEKYEKPKIDAIAVTNGPGLEPCLWTGVNFAKALSYCWNIPIIPVNHIEAHILVNLLSPITNLGDRRDLLFPAICLVVSGGHTQLILMKGIGKYEILGETRDDAAGECFDKTARILGLEYPGGPAIAEQVRQWKSKIQTIPNYSKPNPKSKTQNPKLDIKMPRPMIYSKDYDFSFSGLKTAVLYDFKKRSKKIQKSEQYIQEMCVEIQQSIIDVLLKKTLKATKDYKAKIIILGGGVCANEKLRKQFQEQIKKQVPSSKFRVPSSKLCTDNGLMTALTGYFNRDKQTKNWKKIQVNANLRIDKT